MFRRAFLAALFSVCASFGQASNPAITTGQYNTNRSSSNTNEEILSPSNVNVTQFGKLFSWSVDGWMFAQPLYMPGVVVNGAIKNVVFAATMHNSVYAFDAGNPGAAPLWSVNFGPSVTAPTANGCPSSNFTGPELGILSTPVIDPSSNTLYVVSAAPATGGYIHYLHALDLSTHAEKFGGPVQIQASVPGTGYDAQNGQVALTASSTAVQRTALLLSGGTVYIGFGNCGPDTDPWHGWMLGYTAQNLTSQTMIFNVTPNGGQGGIWQSGRGPAADAAGNLYFNTGNATVYKTADAGVTTGSSSNDASLGNYPMRFLQVTPGGQVGGSYPPANYASLNNYDLDFSSSGPLIIPGSNFVVTGGKDGVIYLFNSGNLASPVQSFQATGTAPCSYTFNGCQHIHDLVFWNNTLYVWGSSDVPRAYSYNPVTNLFNTTALSVGTLVSSYHPPALAVSSSAAQASPGILWALTSDSVFHAYSAANLSSELWNSTMNSARDALPSYPKFTEPTVSNGRVYVATHSDQVMVYGLLSDFSVSTSAPALSVNRGSSNELTLDVQSLGSGSGVKLSVTGLPAGASASVSPAAISGSGNSSLTVTASPTTPTGTYSVLVSGTNGVETRTASVSVVVTTPDVTPPEWSCCRLSQSGSSTVITLTASDPQSGLKSITAAQVANASASVPPITAGTDNPVSFSATESGWASYVKFRVTDVAGNVTYIDPVLVDGAHPPGHPVPFSIKDVTPAEGIVTIHNGHPGLREVLIAVDEGSRHNHIQVIALKDGETRVINIASSIPPSGATVTIIPIGRPAGSAVFLFASEAMSGGK